MLKFIGLWALAGIIAIFFPSIAGALDDVSLDFGGDFQFRYIQDDSPQFHFGPQKNQIFLLSKGVFSVKIGFSESLSASVAVNIFKDDDFKSVYTYYGTGLGLARSYQQGYSIRGYDAYLKYSMTQLSLPNFLKGEVRVGLQRIYFGSAEFEQLITIEDSLAKKEGLIRSRDLGLSFKAQIPNDFGDYVLAVYQGSGYTEPEDNKNKAVLISTNLKPLKLLTFKLSHYFGKTVPMPNPFAGTIENDEADMRRSSISMEIKPKPFYIFIEYLTSKGDALGVPKEGKGMMAIGSFEHKFDIALLDSIQFVYRYDNWDPDTKDYNDGYDHLNDVKYWEMFYGINFCFKTGEFKGREVMMVLQLNYDHREYSEPGYYFYTPTDWEYGTIDEFNKWEVQLRWTF